MEELKAIIKECKEALVKYAKDEKTDITTSRNVLDLARGLEGLETFLNSDENE